MRCGQTSPGAYGKEKNPGRNDKKAICFVKPALFSKQFEIKTVNDPPQAGMGRDLVDYHLKSGKSSQQGRRQKDMSLPVLVH